MGRPRKNLIGHRSGNLVVIRPAERPPNSNNSAYWVCRCDCGNEREVDAPRLRDGHPKQVSSCLTCTYLKTGQDLATRFPEIAKEADGWDPKEIASRSSKLLKWKCKKYGHQFKMRPSERTRPGKGQGCPYCSGKKVLTGFNDLKTIYPEIAKEADGWEPSEFTSGQGVRKNWKCSTCGHTWSQTINKRTPPDPRGCPLCAGQIVVQGVNDLATTHPYLALQAYNWDPTKVSHGSTNKIRKWKCPKCENIYPALIANRSKGRGCPYCAEYGYNQAEEGWMYLMVRPGEQQFGITNDPERRLKTHEKNGWQELDLVGPQPGDDVYQAEAKVKQWLKECIGTVEGTEENWLTVELEVQQVSQLLERADVPKFLRIDLR